MKQIHITRDSSGTVVFEPMSLDATETVFFTNLDPKSEHWPDLITNQLGAAPSANSSAFPVPPPATGKVTNQITYKCKIKGHEKESGTITVYAQLKAVNTSLKAATNGTPIAEQQVVSGGQAPYAISGQQFQITNNNTIVQYGDGTIGPGLQLNAKTSDLGVTVTGTPSVVGTYRFTFTVNDAMGRNLQGYQYTMVVS
jgi:hypothetical protein